jgi:hypothetical protein
MSSIQRNVTGRRSGGKRAPEAAPATEEADEEDEGEDGPRKRRANKSKKVASRRPPRPPVAGAVHISGPALSRRFGIVDMTRRRWELNPDLDFPKPFWINNRKYWVLAEIEARERARATLSAPKVGRPIKESAGPLGAQQSAASEALVSET